MKPREMKWWRTWEFRVIRAVWDLVHDDEMASWFGTDRRRVASARKRLGLRRDRPRYRGKDGIRVSIATEFVKGQRPHNARPAGTVYLRADHGRPVKMISVERGKPIPYAQHVWRTANGDIPKGSFVTFRDGDAMNCELENLMLITRGENAIRNRLKCDEAERTRKATEKRKKMQAYRRAKAVYVDPFIKTAA